MKKFKLEKGELLELLISWVTISFAFAWVGFNGFDTTNFMIILLAVGTGFILHELAHKFTAIHFGCLARFRMWSFGLVLAIGLAIVSAGNFVFAAPGAVYIYGENLSKKQNGLISIAGPFVNIAIALIAAFCASFTVGFPTIVLLTIASINAFLAVFNLLPIPPLDGSKIFVWSKGKWFALFAIAIVTLISIRVLAG